MSINQNMKKYILQVRTIRESPTGAEEFEWVDFKEIDVAIYKTSDTLNTQSVRYNESTHVGITWEKEIKEHECRLRDVAGTIYGITAVDALSKRTTLLLKAVDTDV